MRLFTSFITCLLLATLSNASEFVSTQLKDTIKQGSGDIDLLRASTGNASITTEMLESLRQENGGIIVLAVDINEAANGTEKASTQGVAVKSINLEVVKYGITYSFSQFSTKTQTSLAESGSTNRQMYYTLLGETGSSRLTPNGDGDINGSSFDATLSIPVDTNLSDATSVNLEIELVETNESLGDPEAFYDYSAGFEDLAIITYEDAVYLDALAAGRSSAPLVVLDEENATVSSYLFYPSSSSYYIAVYEDNFPSKGDYDFNDLVVGYQVKYGLDINGRVKTIEGDGYMIAKGGSYNHNWYLHINLPNSITATGSLTVNQPSSSSPMEGFPSDIASTGHVLMEVYSNSQQIFYDPNETFVNTLWYTEHIPGPKFSFSVTLDNGVPINQMTLAPFDPILYVQDTGYEIHLPEHSAILNQSANTQNGETNFKDANGYPFALILPENWLFPNEYVDLGNAYPTFISFVESNNTSNTSWYENRIESGVTANNKNKWKW